MNKEIEQELNIFKKYKRANQPKNEEKEERVDEELVAEDKVDDNPIEEEQEVEERVNEEIQPEEENPSNEDNIDSTEVNEVEEQPIEEEHIIEGYAIVFNSLSEDLGGFREMILPTAINDEVIKNSDIYYLFNHNSESIPLARSKNGEGSLKLTIDSTGLKYSFNCLNSEFYEIVKRGDLDKSSFAFSLPSDGSGEEWIKSAEYNYIRKIKKIDKLYDCSAVLVPAYAETTVYARNNEANKEIDAEYYSKYDSIISELEKSI